MTNYGNDSIDALEGAERVRTRPASVLGSNGIEGARHGFTEIVGNSSDEATAGFGDKLEISYYKDGGVSVRDYGRGVPMGYNEKKKMMNWFLVFNEMYAGGKYEDYQDELKKIKDWSTFDPKDYNYLFSIGLNGLGAASTQYTSSYFTAISYRDGVATEMDFEGGYPIITIGEQTLVATPKNLQKYIEEVDPEFNIKMYEPKQYETDEPNGTFIRWKPDATVFTDVDITFKWIQDKCEAVAYISGISVNLYNEETDKTIVYEKGDITTLLKKENKKKLINEDRIYNTKDLTHGLLSKQDKIYVCQAELSFARTTEAGKVKCFHNAIKMGGGAQYLGISTAMSDFFYTISSEKGVNITSSDYANKFSVIVSSYSNIADYRGQTKDEVEDTFIYTTIKDMLFNLIRTEYHKNNEDIVSFVDEVVREAELRIELQRQSKALRELNKASRTRKLPEKFLPSKNFKDRKFDFSELWIVEGESAKESVKNARNALFQAIYAVRGKMTNALKTPIEAILGTEKSTKDGKKREGSKEIKEIIALIGAGIEIDGLEEESFDITKSRFSKIVMATDADEDGYQIRVLIFAMFWKLMPEVIRQGMLWIAESPKFGITLRDGSRVYAVKDEDRIQLEKEYAGQITRVERYKGLGQVNAEILAETTVNPETRVMTQIQLNPADEDLNAVIETIFGSDPLKKRKETLMQLLGTDVMGMFEENSEMLNMIERSEYQEEVEEVEYV